MNINTSENNLDNSLNNKEDFVPTAYIGNFTGASISPFMVEALGKNNYCVKTDDWYIFTEAVKRTYENQGYTNIYIDTIGVSKEGYTILNFGYLADMSSQVTVFLVKVNEFGKATKYYFYGMKEGSGQGTSSSTNQPKSRSQEKGSQMTDLGELNKWNISFANNGKVNWQLILGIILIAILLMVLVTRKK